jgi:hypothetical protein
VARRCHCRRSPSPVGAFLAGLFLVAAVVTYWYIALPVIAVGVAGAVLVQRGRRPS